MGGTRRRVGPHLVSWGEHAGEAEAQPAPRQQQVAGLDALLERVSEELGAALLRGVGHLSF